MGTSTFYPHPIQRIVPWLLSAIYLQTEQYEQALPVVREQVRRFPDKEVYQKQLANIENMLQQAQAR